MATAWIDLLVLAIVGIYIYYVSLSELCLYGLGREGNSAEHPIGKLRKMGLLDNVI